MAGASWKKALAGICVLVLALTSTACEDTGGADLQSALEHDPMADKALLGLDLVSSEEADMGETKPRPPYVERVFRTEDGSGADALRDAVALAEEDGWTKHPDTSTPTEWRGRRSDDDGKTMVLTIELAEEAGLLTVGLHYL